VLGNFQGTILLVSHDRYLIDALASQVWEIDQDQRHLRVFKGSYSEYRAELEAGRQAEEARRQVAVPQARPRQASRPSQDERRRKARLEQLEAEIAALEQKLAGLSARLENPPPDPETVQALGEDYVETQNEINALLAEWEQLHPLP
jgi:ATP-binding cassette, subfamily F, member 3